MSVKVNRLLINSEWSISTNNNELFVHNNDELITKVKANDNVITEHKLISHGTLKCLNMKLESWSITDSDNMLHFDYKNQRQIIYKNHNNEYSDNSYKTNGTLLSYTYTIYTHTQRVYHSPCPSRPQTSL